MKAGKTFIEKYGSWALVTGASSGIGKALALEAAERGLNIILAARDRRKLEETSAYIQKRFSVQVKNFSADLSTEAGINILIKETHADDIGFLILSAGIESDGPFVGASLEKEKKVIDLNVTSTVVLAHHFAKRMAEKKRGGILFISSLVGHIPSPYFATYAATKSFVLSFGISLYAELKTSGVDVSVLSPGVTETAMYEQMGVDWSKTPVKTMPAEDVAAEAFRHFGKKLSIIPGSQNRLVAFLTKKFLPLSVAALQNEKMIAKAMKK